MICARVLKKFVIGMTLTNVKPELHVAFVDSLRDEWTAGAHYFQNLFFALHALRPEMNVRISLLRLPDTKPSRYFDGNTLVDEVLTFPPEPVGVSPGAMSRQRLRIQRRLGLYRPPQQPALDDFLEGKNVSALFTCWIELGPDWSFPLLTWIPDFQHLHLPDLFTPAELEQRDTLFARIASNATRVVLSSETARRDFEKFYPHAAKKARVLPFVAQVPADVFDTDPRWVCETYHLPERFIYLPNQFWQHKNHKVVIQALVQLQATRPEITVVCTGNTNDDRAPLYFGKLLAEIAQAGVRDQLLLLGWVPYADLFQLMRQSLVVLQPSLFEGWSTTVEETKSLGKPLLISDLPIHREQAAPRALYFDPHDPNALAELLTRAYDEFIPGPDAKAEAEVRILLPIRTREFGQRAVKMFQETMQATQSDSKR